MKRFLLIFTLFSFAITQNYSLSFDGVDDYVEVSSNTSIDDIFSGGGSVSAWIYPVSLGNSGAGRIFDKKIDNTGWTLYIRNETTTNVSLAFYSEFDGLQGSWVHEYGINKNTWTHIAVTYDNSSISNDPTIYI